jgi:hypothetical protein
VSATTVTTLDEGDHDDRSLLTVGEKKDLVKAFIKQVMMAKCRDISSALIFPCCYFQFLEDNPEAVLDSRLMAGLSQKANKLIDQSFH